MSSKSLRERNYNYAVIYSYLGRWFVLLPCRLKDFANKPYLGKGLSSNFLDKGVFFSSRRDAIRKFRQKFPKEKFYAEQ